MKNNFTLKIKNSEQTVYVLEDGTGGGTTSGAVASMPMPVGKVQKRNEAATKPAGAVPKTRNFVAKNAKTSGAGAHADKKRDAKQGADKHKKPFMESIRGQIDLLKEKLATMESGAAEFRKNNWDEPADNSRYDNQAVTPSQDKARMAASAPTQYTVFINGRPWKKFPSQSHATAVMNKLKSKGTNASLSEDGEGTPEGEEGLSTEMLQHIIQQIESEGVDALVKSLTWGDGAAEELLQLITSELKKQVGGDDGMNDGNSMPPDGMHMESSPYTDKLSMQLESILKKK